MGQGHGRRVLTRRLGVPLGALLALLLVGTVGYVLVEGWSVDDALFMAATTITTVGFGEVRPLSPAGRAWTLLLIAVGLALLWYGLSVLVAIVAGGELGREWERSRMERKLERLREHYVVCGYGRVGREIAEQLQRDGQSVVVVDHDAEPLATAAAAGFLAVGGDATSDATLLRARIDSASGLITAVATDADNVFVVLSARSLAADLPIVARASHDETVAKLYRAGASQVVSPYDMAGRQMARLVRRPATVAFVENLFQGERGTADRRHPALGGVAAPRLLGGRGPPPLAGPVARRLATRPGDDGASAVGPGVTGGRRDRRRRRTGIPQPPRTSVGGSLGPCRSTAGSRGRLAIAASLQQTSSRDAAESAPPTVRALGDSDPGRPWLSAGSIRTRRWWRRSARRRRS
jgi:voltage-gated potassium channel